MTKSRYVLLFVVLWLCLTGLIVRVRGLAGFSFSPDDVMLLGIADRATFAETWKVLADQTNAPLMFCILFPLIRISRNELFLRGISLIPGVGLIGVFYFLGKKASGSASGIAMACMAAFGYGSILLSQVVRPYSFMVFFLSSAFYFFLSYSDTGKAKHLFGYITCMLLAIAFHYPAVIPLVAIGIVCFAGMLLQKKTTKQTTLFALAHVPIAVAGAFLFVFHILKVLTSEYHADTKQTYLKAFLPQTFTDVFKHIFDLFEYLFLPPLAPVATAMAIFGLIILWRKGRRQLAASIILTFLLAFALGLLDVFPFGGSRHSFYLFPMVALPMGAFVQHGCELLERGFESAIRPRIPIPQGVARSVPATVGLTVLIASTILVVNSYKKFDFLRRYNDHNGASWMEFPLKRKNYVSVMNLLANNLKEDDVILMNQQTSHYFLWLAGRKDIEYLSQLHVKFPYQGVNSFFIWPWKFETDECLRDALQGVTRYADLGQNSRIWLINLGWHDPVEEILLSDPLYQGVMDQELFKKEAFACALDGRKIIEELSRCQDGRQAS